MKKIIFLLLFIPMIFALDKPHLIKYVNDFANVLDDYCEKELNKLSEEIEKQTTAEIAIVTMKSLCNENFCEDLEKYSNELFRQSGIGKKDKNNGLMILVFVDDKRYRIEIGYGLEGNIPDILVNQIAEKYMKPFFIENNYCSGLYNIVFQFGQEIKGEKNSTIFVLEDSKIKENSEKTSDFIETIVVLIFIIIFVVLMYFSSRSTKKRRSVIIFGGGSSGGGGASGRW